MPIENQRRQNNAVRTKKVCQSHVDGVKNATVYIYTWSKMTDTSVTRCKSMFCKPIKLWTGDGACDETCADVPSS